LLLRDFWNLNGWLASKEQEVFHARHNASSVCLAVRKHLDPSLDQGTSTRPVHPYDPPASTKTVRVNSFEQLATVYN
jgi:hypothetical protein